MFNKTDSKVSTKTFLYRDYKKFEDNKFARDLTHELKNMKTLSYTQFEKAHVLDNHVPLNKKELRFNYGPFMTKALRKTLMTCLGSKTCVKLLRKTKQDYFKVILKVSVILKSSGKRLNLISVTKD